VLRAPSHEYADADELIEDYFARGWTDGLPVVPPTPAKVERFLAAAGLDSSDVLGYVPTREVTVTAEHAAINAVMAGCQAEYMPVVVAAVRAHLDEMANCHSTTGTLSGAAQAVIVNGPVRTEIGIQCRSACLGPGFRANATIGRALRLVIRNVCRAIPGFLDRASFSMPARYSLCFGEDEEGTPWTPLHVERGFVPDQSTVTVQSCMNVLPSTDMASRTPETVADGYVATLRSKGVGGDAFTGDGTAVVLVIGTEHRRFFDAAGWSKDDLRAYVHPKVVVETGEAPGRRLNIRPDGLLFVAAGGDGMGEAWILFPHLNWAVTKPVVHGIPSGDQALTERERRERRGGA
jgi:hypothetical protein